MRLIQQNAFTNFYLPETGAKFFVFSTETASVEFLMEKAFVDYKFDFLLVFHKNDIVGAITPNLQQQLGNLITSGRRIIWIDELGVSDINSCPTIRITSVDQAREYANISFGKDEFSIILDNRNSVGQPYNSTVSFDPTTSELHFKVNSGRKHRMVANESGKNEYDAFVIPLYHQQKLFGLDSRATANNVGSICFQTLRPTANSIQPVTALISPDLQNKNILYSYPYFADASYSQNVDLIAIIYPSLEFDNKATEFQSYLEAFVQAPLLTNFLDELGNNFELPKGETLVSRIAYMNEDAGSDPASRKFFFTPVERESLNIVGKGKHLLLGLSGTERQDSTRLTFLEDENVLYTETSDGDIAISPHADSRTSIAVSPEYLVMNKALNYYIDSEKTPSFDNKPVLLGAGPVLGREVEYDAVKIGSISEVPYVPIIPTLTFKNNPGLKDLEKLLVKRRLLNAEMLSDSSAITPQGFQKRGTTFDFIKNERALGFDKVEFASQFTITNANKDFNISIAKEDVFFVTTPQLLQDARFKDNFRIFFDIRNFDIDLLLANVTAPTHADRIIVFKYSRHTVDELLRDTTKWSNFGSFRRYTDLSQVQTAVQTHFDRFEKKFNTLDASGRKNENYSYIDQTIRRDPNWNGVFVLDVPIGRREDLPVIFAGLLSSQELDADPAPVNDPNGNEKRRFKTGLKFEYVAFPVNKTEINGSGTIDIKSTSYFGLIDYDVLDEPTDKKTVEEFFPAHPDSQKGYKFLLTKLLVRFENSEIRNFKSFAFLQTPTLFDDKVILEGTSITHGVENFAPIKNLVRLEGSYQKNGAGADEFSFTAKGKVTYRFDGSLLLKEISVNTLSFIYSGDGAYRFNIDADALFNNFGVDDIFNISKINFKNIGLTFNVGAVPGFSVPKFDLSSLGVFPDIDFDGNGFLSSFPIKFNSFQNFQFPRVQLDTGDFKLELPELDFFKIRTELPDVDQAWLKDNPFANLFSFIFDIDLGTLGDIEGLKALKGQLLVGWSLHGGFILGFKLSGPSSRGLHLDLFGAMKLDIERVDLCTFNNPSGSKTYFLRLIDGRLTIFGKELPSKDDFDFNGLIYAKPGDKIAWFLAATKKGESGPLDRLVLGVGQRVGPKFDENDRSVEQVLATAKQVFDENLEPCGGGTNPVKEFYKPERNWLVGSEDFIPEDWRNVFNLKFVFNDPALYGISIEIVNWLEVDILYKKLSENLGVYSAELQLAPELRNQDFGGINVTFPNVGVDIYTNGDFKIDVGFPRTSNDWSRSCLIQIRSAPPLVGWAGFYFARLRTASLSLFAQYLHLLPKDPDNSASNPGDGVHIIQAGFAFRVGIGAYIDKGIFYVGASISIYGILEGAFGFNKGNNGLAQFIPDHFALQGRVGAIAELVGYVDFKIVKASIYIILRVEFGFLLVVIKGHGLQPVPVYIEGEVSVSIRFKIACFKIFGRRFCIYIHLSFRTYVRFPYTLGGKDSNSFAASSPADLLPPGPIIVKLGEIPVVYIPSVTKTNEGGNFLVHQFAINLFGTKFEDGKLRFAEKNILKENIMRPIFEAILSAGSLPYSTIRAAFLEGKNSANVLFDVSSYRPTIFAGHNDLANERPFIMSHFGLSDQEATDFLATVEPDPCSTGDLCPFRVIPAPVSSRIRVVAKAGDEILTDESGFKVTLAGLFADASGSDVAIERTIKRSEEYSIDDISTIEKHFDEYMTQFVERENSVSFAAPPKDKDIRDDAIIPEYFKLIGLLTLETYFNFLTSLEANRTKADFNPAISLDNLFSPSNGWDLNENLEGLIGQLNYFYNNGLRLPDVLSGKCPPTTRGFYDLLQQADRIENIKQTPDPAAVDVVFSKADGTHGISLKEDMFAGTGLRDFVASCNEVLTANLDEIKLDVTEVGEAPPFQLLDVRLPVSSSNIAIDGDVFRLVEIPNRIVQNFGSEKANIKLHLASNTTPDDVIVNYMPCTNVEVSVRPVMIDGKVKGVELIDVFARDLNTMHRLKDDPTSVRNISVYLKSKDDKKVIYKPLIQDGEGAKTFLVKTNLSPRTHPPVIIDQTLSAFAPPDQSYMANLEERSAFSRLLWEGVTTNGGGYFLLESINSQLFSQIPTNSDEDVKIVFSFETEIARPFSPFSDFMKISVDAISGRKIFDELEANTHTLYGEVLNENGEPVKEYHSKIPSHCFGFSLARKKPTNPAFNKYLPLEFDLVNKTTGVPILSNEKVLPLMPQHEKKEDGTALLNSDGSVRDNLWLYEHITPLIRQNAEGNNRYSTVGEKFEVRFGFRDVFGFRSVNLDKTLEYTHKYFDKLVPMNSWPFISTSYWYKEFKNNELIFTLKVKAFDKGLVGVAEFNKEKIRDVLNTVIAQISDPNVKVALNFELLPSFDLKNELLTALNFVKQNLNSPKEGEFSVEFRLKVNDELKTKLSPVITVSRDAASELFVDADRSSVWEADTIKTITSDVTLYDTDADNSRVDILNDVIKAEPGCPYILGVSSEGEQARSVYLINQRFLQIKPTETIPLQRSSYFSIRPYSNQLWAGEYQPSMPGVRPSWFSNMDLDSGLSIVLSKLDSLLDPQTVSSLPRDLTERLLHSKKRLVESELKSKTANIDVSGEIGQDALRKEFRSLLLERLENFYRYDGVISLTPAKSHQDKLRGHRLAISVKKHDHYTLRSSKIDFRDNDPKWFILFDQISDDAFIELDLKPSITHIEFDIQSESASPEIERSTWIQLVTPISLNSISTIHSISDKKWPRIVRRFPPKPRIVNHSAEQNAKDGGNLTWSTSLGKWRYVISMLDQYIDGDIVHVLIKTKAFNEDVAFAPSRNFKGFIAFWSSEILNESTTKLNVENFINDLDYQMGLEPPSQSAHMVARFDDASSFIIERTTGGVWKLQSNHTPYDIDLVWDGAAVTMNIGGKGFNLFEPGEKIKSVTAELTASRNRAVKNDEFVYVTDTVSPATWATPHIAFFTPIRLADGESMQQLFDLLRAMNLPYKSTAKLLVGTSDLEADRTATVPVIPIRQMEFTAGVSPTNTAFDRTFDVYKNGYPSISVSIYNQSKDVNDLPVFNAINIFKKAL